MEGLEPEIQDEGVQRARLCADIAHELRDDLRDIRAALPKTLRVDESVIARIGFRQTGELVLMGDPVEVARVDDRAADRRRMTVEVL